MLLEAAAANNVKEWILMASYTPLVLTIDDDPAFLESIAFHAQEWGYAHRGVQTVEEMWRQVDQAIPNVILLDIHLGDMNGTMLVRPLLERFPDVPIIMVTAHGTIDAAVQCIKAGAYDFVTKPIDPDRLRIELGKAVERNRLTLRVKDLESADSRHEFSGMIGGSMQMREVYRLIECVAPTDATVLILGETGTGKELVAGALHDCGKRSGGPFVPVNAAAIPHELIESVLFGHKKGAFTGAHQNHVGYCEQADRGTLFLDEIVEMEYGVQAKLLRFLENHVVQRVGEASSREVDVRIIAATNREPKAEIQAKKLREDLYCRLNVVTISLPPLRERHGDLSLLAHHFLDRLAAKYDREMRSVSPEALEVLSGYDWPGNVRELEGLIEQVVVTNEGAELSVAMLPSELRSARGRRRILNLAIPDSDGPDTLPSMEEAERRLILEALHRTAGSVAEAAKQLDISEATIYRKIKKYGLQRPVSAK